MITLLAHAKIETYEQADEILQMEIIGQNPTKQGNTGKIPLETWDQAILGRNGRLRPTPVSSLLDLRLSMGGTRRVNNDQTIDFEGRNYEIAATSRKSGTIGHHSKKILGRGPPSKGRLAANFRDLRALIDCPVLNRPRIRFCTVADTDLHLRYLGKRFVAISGMARPIRFQYPEAIYHVMA